ncbi:hypothetical protein ACWEJ6_21145 [Nonomuraea sp. NPDC004702]
MLLAIAGTLGLLLGYLSGRSRPLRRARDWARWTLMGFGPQSTLCSLVSLALLPDYWARIWKRRNDPPRTRAEAPKLNPDWEQKLDEHDN